MTPDEDDVDTLVELFVDLLPISVPLAFIVVIVAISYWYWN